MTRGGRGARLAAAIREELAEMIAGLGDPRLHAGLITVTKVELNVDFTVAKVWVSVVGADVAVVLKALAGAAGRLRGEVGRRLGVRHAPELRFQHDRSAEQVARIEDLLKGDGHD